MFHSWLARATGVPLSELPPGAVPHLPEPLHSVAAAMWRGAARDGVHVSRFQQEVAGGLLLAGYPVATEWLTDDGNFSIDVGLEVNEQGVAVEVDGTHHFSSNAPHRPLGDQETRRSVVGWLVGGWVAWSVGRAVSARGAGRDVCRWHVPLPLVAVRRSSDLYIIQGGAPGHFLHRAVVGSRLAWLQ